jgi:hypothetical protein
MIRNKVCEEIRIVTKLEVEIILEDENSFEHININGKSFFCA